MTIKVHVSKDAAEINRVLNHPEVRPWIASASEGVLNVQAQIDSPHNIFLMGEHGGQMYTRIMPGIFEVHSFVLPEGRGGWALELSRATLNWIFTRTDAVEVLTRIPETHRAAKGLAIKAGMTSQFYRTDGVKIDGVVIPVDVYKINVHDWASKAPELTEAGHQFHEWLNTQAAHAGFTQPHDEDPEHDRIVGASIEMLFGGQPVKAVAFYNRWAWISRHATISLVSVSPIVLGFDIGQLKLAGSGLEFVPNGGSRCSGVSG